MTNGNGSERIFGRKFLEKSIAASGIQETLKTKKDALLSNVKHWVDMLDKGIVKDEESFQDPFINDIFKGALGYTRQGDAILPPISVNAKLRESCYNKQQIDGRCMLL